MNGEPGSSAMLLSWTALAGGLVLLTGGGELLISGAAKLAKRLGMSSLLIGMTIVAFGTSMPELFVGLVSLFRHHPDILTGNVIGSNIANIGLILGLCSIITPLPVHFRAVSLELYIGLAGTIAVFLAAWHGTFPRFLGVVFFAALIIYTLQSFRLAGHKNKKMRQQGEPPLAKDRYPLAKSVMMTVAGLVCLPLGSNFFLEGAVELARHYGVSELFIGLTLAAIGTSLPELASCLAAVRQRQTELLAGNIIGSNLFNILMVLGFSGMLIPFPMSGSLLTRDIPIMFSFSAVLIPILAVQQGLRRLHGIILLAAYAGYLYILR